MKRDVQEYDSVHKLRVSSEGCKSFELRCLQAILVKQATNTYFVSFQTAYVFLDSIYHSKLFYLYIDDKWLSFPSHISRQQDGELQHFK
jgi:hypothetical protein